MIYNTRRTASVISKNYGSIARIDDSGFESIQRQIPGLTTQFKLYCLKYKDDLREFLEMASNKITYFNNLSMVTKQELLFNMERKVYHEGDRVFEEGSRVEKMVII